MSTRPAYTQDIIRLGSTAGDKLGAFGTTPKGRLNEATPAVTIGSTVVPAAADLPTIIAAMDSVRTILGQLGPVVNQNATSLQEVRTALGDTSGYGILND